jgi:phosphonate transport system substrate-binding protein
MMLQMKHRTSLTAALCTACLLLVYPATQLRADEVKTYSLGVVPQFEARKLRAIWQPIVDHIEQKSGYQLEIQGSPSIPEFEKQFLQGQFDFAYMNPYHFLLANESQHYTPLVRDVGRSLHGVLVVKKDSPIKTVNDLHNKVIAFPSPNALGASLQMRQELHDQFSLQFTPIYVKTHDSVYLNVLLDSAAAGGGVQKTLRRQPTEVNSSLRIIHQTRDVAPHPLAAHPRVPIRVVEAVKEALISLGQTDQGRARLARIPIKTIGPAIRQDYLPLKRLKLERFYQP